VLYNVHKFFEAAVPVNSNTIFGALQIHRDEREEFGKKKKCALFSAVTCVLKISIQYHIQEDHNLHIYCCKNLKCDDRYFVLF
jgi:hypothetical protein